MNLSAINCFESDVVILNFDDENDAQLPWKNGQAIELLEDDGLFYVKQYAKQSQQQGANHNGQVNSCFAQVDFQLPRLKLYATRSASHGICCYLCYHNDKALAIRFMVLKQNINQAVVLSFDQASIQSITKAARLGNTIKFDRAKTWFEQQFLFDYNNAKGMLLAFGQDTTPGLSQSFVIVGEGYQARVSKSGHVWLVHSVKKTGQSMDGLSLFWGLHQLQHQSAENLKSNQDVQFVLEQHTQDHGSYFKLWRAYADAHWQMSLRLAKLSGYLSYEHHKATSDEKIRYEFILGEQPIGAFIERYSHELENTGERFSLQNIELEVAAELPGFLSEQLGDDGKLKQSNKKPNFLTNIQIQKDKLTADLTRKPPKTGVIYLSLNGMKKQHERKQVAFDLISQGNNPLPQLRFLVEGLEPPSVGRVRNNNRFSQQTRQMIKQLTPKQQQALKIALATSDIAVIIGPPGTGKTKVISALQQCIAEIGAADGLSLEHQILLTSYQHDAVNHVVAKAGVFGLPAFKVGGRIKGEQAGAESAVKQWANDKSGLLTESIAQQLLQFEEYQLFEQINDLIIDVRVSDCMLLCKAKLALIEEKLTRLRGEFALELPQKFVDEFYSIVERFNQINGIALTKNDRQIIYRLVRGLRTTQVSWDDDGQLRLEALKHRLKQHQQLTDFDQQLNQINHDDLTALAELKDNLLLALAQPYIVKDKRFLSDSEINTLEQIQMSIEQSFSTSSTLGQLHIRKQYVDALKDKPYWVEQSIKQYVTVLGATCQQAAGESMTNIKSVQSSSSIEFDSVIVDEAARANPLDLMIPMAMAKKRVVLVGDHMQLPHMLEPKVEIELQQNNEVTETETELLKQSLFHRLYNDVYRFAKQPDGKTRAVMLDTQFRMHPTLGAFHSREFYQKYRLPEVKSGRDEQDFPQDVPGFEGKLAAWVSMPQSKGPMKSHQGSKYRICEAKKIAKIAFDILQTRADLSIGIITFYAAQRDKIQQQMVSHGVMERKATSIEVVEDYQYLSTNNTEQEERFRVGSVDAFQGKEFDVVLLSTVRHWPANGKLSISDINSHLGFLRIVNRINVAMSRQRRLLIVVGCPSLTHEDLMEPLVIAKTQTDDETDDIDKFTPPILPGFGAFFKELCQGEFTDV